MNLKDVLFEHRASTERWQTLLERKWQEQVHHDESEVDIDLLAAYAEGRLSAKEELISQDMLAASPAAVEIFLSMREAYTRTLDAELRSSEIPETAAAASQVSPAERSSPQNGGRISHWRSSAMYTTAACLLLAVISAGIAGNSLISSGKLASELATLQEHLNRANKSLDDETAVRINQTLLENKELGITLAAERRAVFLAGRISPAMLMTTLQSKLIARGSEAESPENSAFRRQVAQRLEKTINDLPANATHSRSVVNGIEIGMQQILSENLPGCRQTLNTLKAEFPSEPAVANLEAVLLLATAENSTDSEAQLLFSEAGSILQDLTAKHPDFETGWLNLALLTEQQEGIEAARPFWEGCLSATQDEDLRSIIRGHLTP